MSRLSAVLGRALAATLRAGRRAGSRFPVGVLALVAISVLANADVAHFDPFGGSLSERVYATLFAAGAASVLLRLAGEARGWRRPTLDIAPLAAAALAGAAIYFGRAPVLLPAPLLLALVLAVPLAPYVGRPDGPRFWTFTLWTAVGMTLAFLSVLLFVVGVSAILEMVRFLFGVGLGWQAYEHIYTTAATLVGPVFALGRIPRDFDETPFAGGVDRLASGVQAMVDFVAAPLVLASSVVIHLYAAKMAVLGEVPANEVGWIASLFVLIALGLRIAADPFLARGFATTRLFGRLWGAMLVVPLALLAYALALRVADQGVTIERFYLGLWTFAGIVVVAAQLVPRLRGDVRIMAGVPVALLALSAIGPIGAPSFVARSQGERIVASLGDRSETGLANLRTRLQAADEVDVLPWIAARLPEPGGSALAARLAATPGGERYAAALDVLGAGIAAAPETPQQKVFASSQALPFAVEGYDLVTPELTSAVPIDGPEPLSMRIEGERLAVTFRGVEDRLPFSPALDRLTEADFAAAPQAVAPKVVDAVTDGGRHVRLRLTRAVIEGDARTPVSVSAVLALRGSEWPAGSLGGG